MIKFLADENIPFPVVEFLRGRGFDVQKATEGGIQGASDDAILQAARKSGRVLLTFDKHFANILVYPPESHFGIIRIRLLLMTSSRPLINCYRSWILRRSQEL